MSLMWLGRGKGREGRQRGGEGKRKSPVRWRSGAFKQLPAQAAAASLGCQRLIEKLPGRLHRADLLAERYRAAGTSGVLRGPKAGAGCMSLWSLHSFEYGDSA